MSFKYWKNLEIPSNANGSFLWEDTYWRIRSYGKEKYYGGGGRSGFVYNFVRHGHNNTISVWEIIERHNNYIKIINDKLSNCYLD